jgi:hypothetical protein
MKEPSCEGLSQPNQEEVGDGGGTTRIEVTRKFYTQNYLLR